MNGLHLDDNKIKKNVENRAKTVLARKRVLSAKNGSLKDFSYNSYKIIDT